METLIVECIEAKGLLGKDRDGLSDPFVEIKFGSFTTKSKTIPKSLNPKWNQPLLIEISPESPSNFIEITVWDQDTISNDFLGRLNIPIRQLVKDITPLQYSDPSNASKWFSLMKKKKRSFVGGEILLKMGFNRIFDIQPFLPLLEKPCDWTVYCEDSDNLEQEGKQGEATEDITANLTESILKKLNLDFNEAKGLLILDIVRANLVDTMDKRTLFLNSDPFMIITFGEQTFKTRTVKRTLNPEWNERTVLSIRTEEISYTIKFAIYDQETLTKNDFISCAELRPVDLVSFSSANKMKRKAHYISLSKPDGSCCGTFQMEAQFLPQNALRVRFWIELFYCYDENRDHLIDINELSSMMESLNITTSDESLERIFKDSNYSLERGIPVLDLIFKIESKTLKNQLLSDLKIKSIHCTFCNEKIKGMDVEIINHLAMCYMKSNGDFNHLVSGGYITEEQAQRKGIAKILSTLGFGKYGLGTNNAIIIVRNRKTGALEEEKMPMYIRIGIRLLYKNSISKSAVETKKVQELFRRLTIQQGMQYDSPRSKNQIYPFINFYNINTEEILEDFDNFNNFNEFFYRKLKPEARTLVSEDRKVAVSPADCRMMVFPTVSLAKQLWIKGKNFTVGNLIQDKDLAASYQGGSLVIARLAPQDYHRYHFPIDGVLISEKSIPGEYYTVNPMAVREKIDVYTENKRMVHVVDSPHFGKVVIVPIGAMMVGSIVITSKVGSEVKRLEEHGYFAFGGSTLVLLFPPNSIQFDKDLISNSNGKLETLITVGDRIGKSIK